MSGILYIVIAIIVTIVSLYVGVKIARNHRTPLARDQFMDSVANTAAVTAFSLIIGIGWVIAVPVLAIGYGVFKIIYKNDEA